MVVRVDDVQGSPSVTSPPSLGATPTTRGSNDLIPARLLDTSQGVSHFQPTDTTQLCRRQLSPVSLQHDESIFELTHGGGQPLVAVYLSPQGRVVAPLDRVVDARLFVITPGEEEKILLGVDLPSFEGKDGACIKRRSVDVIV